MKTQDIHIRALRAATRVTASFRKFAIGSTIAIAMAVAPGCANNNSNGGTSDTLLEDTAALLDTITRQDSATPPKDTTTPPGDTKTSEDSGTPPGDTATPPEDTATPPEDTATPPKDTSVADATPADATPADVAMAPSCMQPNGVDCTADTDCADEAKYAVYCIDGQCNEPDFAPNQEAIACCEEHYAKGETALGCNKKDTCLQPNGMDCETATDCQVPEKYSFECVDKECHEMDITPNEMAQKCCNEQYNINSFGIAGCNPWGPPAPPMWNGEHIQEPALKKAVA